jgi:hemoglobin/transferrin/lactoferrin receptor protein
MKMGLARLAAALLCGTAMGAVGIVGAASAQAQNQNARNLTLLEKLVIGAGAPKVAVNTPQSVTVVDQADIDQKQAETTGEIFDDMPGVTMVGSERVYGETFNIRGVGSSDSPTSSGDGSKIIINVDGAQKFYEQYRMGSFFSDPELYKQVEVLRGPASSTLYGSGALGGVINFTTKDAADFIKEGMTGAVRFKQGFTSNGWGTLTSLLIAQHISDTFDILATGTFRRSEVQQMANGQPLQGSEFDAWSGLIKGTAYLDDGQVVRLSYQRWMGDQDNISYNQTGFIPAALGGFGNIDRNVTDQTAILSYEAPAPDDPLVDFKASLSWADTLVQQRNPSNPAVASIGPADYGYTNYQLNVQNASEFSGDNWSNVLTYGGTYNFQKRIGLLTNGGIITTHPEGQQTKVGLFVQDEHTINDNLTVIGGLRADFVHLVPSAALAGNPAVKDDIALSPKIAALYQVNDGLNVFGSVAHTERVPSLDELFQYQLTGPAITRTASLQLVKERSDNFELGFSTQTYDFAGIPSSALGFKVTGFYNLIKNGIRSNPNYVSAAATPGLPYFVNVADMRIYGVEVEGSFESDVAFGRVAVTVARGEYASAVSPAIPAGSVIDTLAQDKVVITVGGRAFEGDLEYGAKVTVAAAPLYALSAASGAMGTATAWQTVDLFASWKPTSGPWEGLEATASIENLFDADYRENLALDRSRGRTVKLTVARQLDY